MPRDPFDFFGRGNRGNEDHNNNNNNNDNHINPNDPFNDPFFRHFSDMSRHMDRMFEDFFKDAFPNDIHNGNNHTIIIDSPNFNGSSNRNNNQPSNGGDRPHLSQINPNIPSSTPDSDNNNVIMDRRNNNRRNDLNDPFDMFRDFFGFGNNSRNPNRETYSQPSLSDINPDYYNGDNNSIINDKNQDSNLIHPNAPPPGFRSPYLPNWNGEEKSIDAPNENNSRSFFRSQSVVINTTPDGRTTKTTTIRDENGNIQESTETFDSDPNDNRPFPFRFGFGANGNDDNSGSIFGFPRSMIDFGSGYDRNGDSGGNPPSLNDDILNNGNSNDSERDRWVMTPNDPFGRWRHSIEGWKSRVKGYWFGNRDYGKSNGNGSVYGNNDDNGGIDNGNPIWFRFGKREKNKDDDEWFWKYRNNNNKKNNNDSDEGYDGNGSRIEWKSNSRDYRKKHPNRDASILRDEIIVKPKIKQDE